MPHRSRRNPRSRLGSSALFELPKQVLSSTQLQKLSEIS
jgi:hypothetical protein